MNDLNLILKSYLEGRLKFSQMYEQIALIGYKLVCFQRCFGKTLLKVKDSEGNLICINPDENI